MPRHGELSQGALYLVGYLGCEGYLTIDVALQSDGNQLIGVRSKIFSHDEFAVTLITVAHNGRVEIQRSAIVLDFTKTQILDVERAQGLVILRVRPLNVQLQGIGKGIILLEQGLTDGWYPLVGISIEVAIYGLTRPEGDVVQVDYIIIGTSVDKGTQLTIAYGQRLLEVGGGFVILKHHGGLLCLCFAEGKASRKNSCN